MKRDSRTTRHELFLELAPQGLLGREKRVLDDLLRERARAHQIGLIAADIREHRADGADRIDARVIVEPAIFNRQNGVDHRFRDRGERHVAPLLAGGEGGEERRFERDPIDGLATDFRQLRDDRRGALREVDADDADAILLGNPRRDEDESRADREFTGPFGFLALGIADIVQPLHRAEPTPVPGPAGFRTAARRCAASAAVRRSSFESISRP